MRRTVHAGFSNGTHVETSFGFPHGRGMRARAVANFALHRGSDIVNRVTNFGDHLRVGVLELRAHGGRRRLQQLEEILARNVAALAERQGQLAIISRAGCKLSVAGKRETRAFVSDDAVHDPLIAPLNKDVGYELA